MKKRREKSDKTNNSPENESDENKEEEEIKQVGIFKGFLVYDRIDQNNENELNFNINDYDNPFFQEWLILHHNKNNSNKTESRFSNLFKEILQIDKNKENNDNKNIENEINDKNLIPQNLIEDNEEDKKEENNNKNNDIKNIDEKMENLNINDNIIDNNNFLNNNNSKNNIFKNTKNFENNIINNNNNNHIEDDNNQNINIIHNTFPNINTNNNNNIINQNIPYNYTQNININNNFNIINNPYAYLYQDKRSSDLTISNSNSGYYPSNTSSTSTAPSSMDRKNSMFSLFSNSSRGSYGQKKDSNNSKKNSKHDSSHRFSEKKFDLNIDIKRIIYLEDRRTTLMIKNIPNKFHRDLILKIIDENFKEAYDLFILPTDASGYKNFGYSFINFINCYHIPYFYYLFNNKNWSSTNSRKICSITYSKIQGRNSLLSHYANKIIFKNEAVKKLDVNTKFIIPNEYFDIFNSAFPNYNVEKFDSYFITKLPFRY